MTLPPHFWVYLLAMVSSGQKSHIEGFRTEQQCKTAAAQLNASANSGIRFKCEAFPIMTR